MKITLIKKEKNYIVFDVDGEIPTFFNALSKLLSKDNDVIQASYHIYHPLYPLKGKFVLKTKTKDALEVLKKALNEMKDYVEKI